VNSEVITVQTMNRSPIELVLGLLMFITLFLTCKAADDTISFTPSALSSRDFNPMNSSSTTIVPFDNSTFTTTAATTKKPTGSLLCRLFRIGCPSQPKVNDSKGCCIKTEKNKDRVRDGAGNRYGKFEGMLVEQLNQTSQSKPYKAITYYKKVGIISSYPDAFCGNTVPVQPILVKKGLIQWNEAIDYGICDPARISLAQSSEKNKTWVNTYQFEKIFPYGSGPMKWSCLRCSEL
jgi:hypothetical protein